jgi:CRP-like cAMP-binding protein
MVKENDETPQKTIEQILLRILQSETHSKIAEKKAGMYFGEQALIDEKENKRTATVIALEDCHTAEITKETFTEVLEKAAKSTSETRADLLRNIPIFQGLKIN